MCSCAYPCTDECGSDVKVGLIVKLIGRKVRITSSITNANEMWARSPKSALSRRTLHYPTVDLDKHWNECGHDRPSWHYLGLPFTIPKWISSQLCKVDMLQSRIGPILGNVGFIRSGFGPKLNKVGIIECGFGSEFGKVDIFGRQN